MRRVVAMLAIFTMASCGGTPARIALRGGDVLGHLDELGTDGKAELVTVRTSSHGETPADRETIFLYATVTYHGETTTLAKVLEGCGPFAGAKPCTLGKTEYIVLRAAEKVAAEATAGTSMAPKTNGENHDVAVVTGGLALASFTGMTICLFICGDNKTEVSVALAGAGLVFLVIAAVASGARD